LKFNSVQRKEKALHFWKSNQPGMKVGALGTRLLLNEDVEAEQGQKGGDNRSSLKGRSCHNRTR
jgi:hypothetical protein